MMITQLHFFYTDQQLAAIQTMTLESPGKSMASVATGKKQNTTRQLLHFIVIRHPHLLLLLLFCLFVF